MQGSKALARQIALRQFSWSECCRAGSPLVLHEVQKAMPNSKSLVLTTWHFFTALNIYHFPLHYGWFTLVYKGGEAVFSETIKSDLYPARKELELISLQLKTLNCCYCDTQQSSSVVGGKGPQCLRISLSTLHLCKGSALWHIAAWIALCFFPELPARAHVGAVVRVVMLWLLSGAVPLVAVICTEDCRGHQRIREL